MRASAVRLLSPRRAYKAPVCWRRAQDMDLIFLYRRPILDYWCESGENLKHVIHPVPIHEIGHHFGLSDEDMERIEAEAAEG